MQRERALKVVLVVVGFLFVAGIYPLIGSLLHPADSDTGDTMMLSLYVTLGIFLLLAVRNPSAHRSLIAFAACSSFAHGAVMGVQGFQNVIARRELVGVAAFIIIGVVPRRAGSGKTARRAGCHGGGVGFGRTGYAFPALGVCC